MKKISEMTTEEIREKINLLYNIDSKETAGLLTELETEVARREEEAKEAEAKRQEEEERNAAEEEKALRKKQHDVLGKCFKIVDTDYKLAPTNYYKVIGVVNDYAVTRMITSEKSTYTKLLTTSPYSLVKIDKLLEKGESISNKEFKDVEQKSDTEFNKYFNTDTFENMERAFKNMFKSFWWA